MTREEIIEKMKSAEEERLRKIKAAGLHKKVDFTLFKGSEFEKSIGLEIAAVREFLNPKYGETFKELKRRLLYADRPIHYSFIPLIYDSEGYAEGITISIRVYCRPPCCSEKGLSITSKIKSEDFSIGGKSCEVTEDDDDPEKHIKIATSYIQRKIEIDFYEAFMYYASRAHNWHEE